MTRRQFFAAVAAAVLGNHIASAGKMVWIDETIPAGSLKRWQRYRITVNRCREIVRLFGPEI